MSEDSFNYESDSHVKLAYR